MRNDLNDNEITYVLFGKEAIKLHRLSLKALTNSIDVNFRVGAYSSIKKFVNDTKEWDDFAEISKEDFLILRKINTNKVSYKSKKRTFFSRLFK
ncbi:MAG: hypothetical protein HKN90_10110 [Flavobacteriaceae bacterium]|nr:hypothetical protein [Flavobacteriaceae bacterium]